MHRTTIYLPYDIYEALQRLAWLTGTTYSDLLRHAAEQQYEHAFKLAASDLKRWDLPPLLASLSDIVRAERYARDRRLKRNRPTR